MVLVRWREEIKSGTFAHVLRRIVFLFFVC
jgi:hypothetical protein